MTEAAAKGSPSVALGFLGLREIRVPRGVANDIHEFLRQRGTLGVEAVGFWAGIHAGDVFDVEAAIIPDQKAASADEGLAVLIDGETLFDMNMLLHQRGWTLVAQIHSHPTDAYHSETDNDYSVMTRVGSLSIVVPDFARGAAEPTAWETFRLDSHGRWARLPRSTVTALITLVD